MRPITTFRNSLLSLWQSAIHKVVSAADPQAAARLSSNQHVMIQFVAAANAFVSGLPPPQTDDLGDILEVCATLAIQLVGAEIIRDQERITELTNELRMSTCDPGWTQALTSYLEFRKQGGAIPYIRYNNINDFVIPIPNHIQTSIFRDSARRRS